ncbi:hypothetical protein M758_3G262500 [Ceratodon purpureus]|nr:hypothetical protein M758_3G262500 [Ceratodon purpureus]
MDQWGRVGGDATPAWSRKRKSLERGDVKGVLPNKKFQSPLIITAPSGKTATKTKSRLPLCDGNGSLDEDQIKQQFLARISEAEALLKQKRNTSQESILASLCKSGLATPRKVNSGITTPNPFSFMTPGRRRESVAGRRESVVGRRDSVCGRRSSISGRRENLYVRTPCAQQSARVPMSARKMRLRASMQLKMLESQEQQVSRAAQVKWEVWMDKQERAYGGLLNDILKQTMDPNVKVMEIKHSVGSLGRSSGHGVGIGSLSLDSSRCHFINSGRTISDDDKKPFPVGQQNRRIVSKARMSASRTSREMKDSMGNDLQASDACLNQICSVLELKRRLVPYLEDSKCDRIISTMTQIAKYIDDGRLRMKPNCIILSDVALRTKAFDVLFSYNPVWLRLGLAIILGPIASINKSMSTLDVIESEGENHPQTTFLQVLIEEHFFGDSLLAKQFATNKSIDGLYRDGYKEALGKIILKRIFLLVLVLDKIKSETALDGQRGIDGLDGGSPILFQPNGCVKSSRQALEDFLSHVMQGEGDLIVHVGKLGYHVSHTQAALSEYNFEVRNVVDDLQDGIRLCRLAQLMSHDFSILERIKFPCQAPKKRTHNCELALKSLAQSGVLLEDETGAPITAEHISSGQREKTLSLIWNLILHLQVPLLVSHPKLFQELERVGLVANPDAKGYAVLDLLLSWVQAICSNVDGVTIENFTTSFADGQVLCHLISNFLPQCLPRHAIKIPRNSAFNVSGKLQEERTNQNDPWDLRSAPGSDTGLCEDRPAVIHNFQMVENAAKLLGIGPEVLRISDMVDGDPCTSERNVIIFIAHLCSALLNANPQDFQSSSNVVPTSSKEVSDLSLQDCSKLLDVHSYGSCSSRQDKTSENAATCIQAWYKGRRQRLMFESIRTNVILLQRFVRVWLVRERILKERACSRSEEDDDLVVFQVDESEPFQGDLEFPLCHVLRLQSWVRNRKLRATFLTQRQGARTIQNYWQRFQFRRNERRTAAASIIQASWRGHLVRKLRNQRYWAACTIQRHFRGHILRVQIQKRKAAALLIQRIARGGIQRSSYRSRLIGVRRLQALFRGALVRAQAKCDANNVTKIQALWRGWSTRTLLNRWRAAASVIQSHFRGYKQRIYYKKFKVYIAQIQAAFRGLLLRNKLRLMRQAAVQIQSGWRSFKMRRVSEENHAAATRIQSRYRCIRQRTWYQSHRSRVILMQTMVRGHLARKRYSDMRFAVIKLQSRWRGCLVRRTMGVEKLAAMHIQKCVRSFLQYRRNQLRETQCAAITIQSFYRGYVQRKLYHKEMLAIVRIQYNWRGFVQRRNNESAAKDAFSKEARYSAACIIQASWRGQVVRKKRFTHAPENCAEQLEGGCNSTQQVTSSQEHSLNEQKAAQLLSLWAKAKILRCRFLTQRRAVVAIQSIFRGRKARRNFNLIIRCICRIQAHWRGHKWRSGQSRMKQHMQELRLRMQSTAASVDDSQRLGNRLTEALAQLLSQKTVSGILHICATIDMATEHSKHCCERLAEGGAVTKLLMLIQTVNRSPPHEQVLKHALSILANLARFPNLAFLIAGEADSINIIVEQLLIFRNKEEVFSKAMKILLHVCRTPGCVDIIQKDLVVIRRLHNVAVLLERRFEVEKRNLEKLAPSTPTPVRKAADHKMRETIQQKQSIMSIMPDLLAKQLNQNPPPAAPCRLKDTVSNNYKPPLSTTVEENRASLVPATMVNVKSSNTATKVSTAAFCTSRPSTTISNKKVNISQRPVRGAPLQATRLVPLSGDRKPEGAIKVAVSRPNPFSSGRGERAPSNSGMSVRPKSGNASQNGLLRAPLKDRSNDVTKVLQK